MQKLYQATTTDHLGSLLEAGALVVWINNTGTELWDAVLEHPDYAPQQDAVLAFLESVNPGALNEAMVRGIRLSQSPAESALQALLRLAGGSDERP